MRNLLRLPLLGCLLLLLYLNILVHYEPRVTTVNGQPTNQELLGQLRFLKGRLHGGAAEDMQQLYPEGYVYLNSLYALTWVELAASQPDTSSLFREAVTEADWATRAIHSAAGKVSFDAELPLAFGAYYQGWSTYVLGRTLAVRPAARRAAADELLFQQRCADIARVLADSPTPYPESYRGAAWPADGVMCAAALAWHDRLFAPRYQPLLQHWLRKVDTHLDARGLLPHSTDAQTGHSLEEARGSSQSQLLNFLIEIDSAYARRHFRRYRAHFLASRFGLPGIRESAQEAADVADIDSGPVVLGIGGAASIVGRRTFQLFDDTVTAVGLRNSIEAFGLAYSSHGEKSYLFGQLPIADAFIAWSNSLETARAMPGTGSWQLPFHGLSALLAVGLVAALRALRPRKITQANIPERAR